MTELKPCPFCGPESFVMPLTRQPLSPDAPLWTAVLKCDYCGISLSGTGVTEELALKSAIEAWNTRAERTCHLERIPYEPGEYEGMRCSVCKTVDLEMGVGPYCPGCGAKVVE